MSDKELIGYASVDSGHIAITDPCYMDGVFDFDNPPDWYSQGLGVIVHTKIGDGIFPVYFEEENGGGIGKSRIIIEFDI